MAFITIPFEDSSPLISYAPDGAWLDTPNNDTLISSYSGGSLHTTPAQGATATVQFSGTGISIFGGHRPSYGSYTISVDGQTIMNGNGSSSTAMANQLLGSISGLPNGLHTAILTNTGVGSAVDIDWIEFESPIGPAGSNMTSTTYDDTDPRITYTPSDAAWSTNNLQEFMNGTLHFTSTPGAQASLSFSGDAVAIYGTVSPDHTNIQVMVDGQSKTFTGGSGGFVNSLHPKTLLYFANNLGSQGHNVIVTAVPQPGAGQFMDVDAITVFSTVGTTSEPSGSTSNSTSSPVGGSTSQSKSSPQRSGSVSKTTIIAASVGSAVGLLLIMALVVVFLSRRQRQHEGEHEIQSPVTPELPMQKPGIMEAGLQSPNERTSYFDSQLAYAGSASHARAFSGSSFRSTAPILVRDVPLLDIPRPPAATVARFTPGSNPGPMMNAKVGPVRPILRPPTLHYD